MAKSLPTPDFNGLPPWMAAMRKAAFEAISIDDVQAIVKKQVELAKQGDEKALKFVFEQVLGGNSFKGATFVQNNYTAEASPAKPTKAKPGSTDKIELMAARAASGNGVFHPEDSDHSGN